MIDRFVIKIIDEGMLTMKKLFALMLALAMMLTVVCAFAEGDGGEGGETGGETTTSTKSTPSITIESTSKEAEAATDTTQYTWYRILEADIGSDPESNGVSQSGGAVSYHVDDSSRATALASATIPGTETKVFKVTKTGDINRWYVELMYPDTTSGADIAAALEAIDLSAFPTGTFSQTAVAGTANSGDLAPGYYYIKSTAGKNVAVQTLTAVTIKEKNEFPTVTKEIPEKEKDKNAQIGDEITFNMTVTVPSTANDTIVLEDTMTAGLSFKEIESIKIGDEDVGTNAYTITSATDGSGFTLTFSAEFITSAAAQADTSSKTTEIDIVYKAILDGDAKASAPEKNSVVLKYGQHYETVPKEAEVKTYDFKFNKVDGSTGDQLAGAEFQFLLNGTPMDLIEVTPGEVYRIALPDEAGRTQTITTIGKTVQIYGLDIDVQAYSLQETKAPDGGYNILKAPVDVKPENGSFVETDVKNNEGAVLPSTGGSGTTIFYVIGGLLIIGAAVVLVARRKAQE